MPPTPRGGYTAWASIVGIIAIKPANVGGHITNAPSTPSTAKTPPTGMGGRGRKSPNVVANGAKTNKMVQLFCNTLIFM